MHVSIAVLACTDKQHCTMHGSSINVDELKEGENGDDEGRGDRRSVLCHAADWISSVADYG